MKCRTCGGLFGAGAFVPATDATMNRARKHRPLKCQACWFKQAMAEVARKPVQAPLFR